MSAEDLTASQIALKAFNRDDGRDAKSLITMELIDNEGDSKLRELEILSRDYGPLSRRLTRFLAPTAIRGTAFLSRERESGREDQFLYLPSVRRSRRIGGDQLDRSFVNTDLTYEDLERRNPNRDTFALISEDTLHNRPVWVLERTAIDPEDSQYGKVKVWLTKAEFFGLRLEMFDKSGAKIKTITVDDAREVQGILSSYRTIIHDLRTNHKTILSVKEIVYNSGLSDNLFTEAEMEQFR